MILGKVIREIVVKVESDGLPPLSATSSSSSHEPSKSRTLGFIFGMTSFSSTHEPTNAQLFLIYALIPNNLNSLLIKI
jgi:hypothetical protein